MSIGVLAVMRRANLLSSTTFHAPSWRAISITAPPTAAISTSAWAFDVLRLVSRPLPRPANIRLELTYSWLATSRKRSPLRLPAGSA